MTGPGRSTPDAGRSIVFLGPSLGADEARAIAPGIRVLPPAGMGDVLSAVRHHRPTAVGLIDGTFLQNMAVFHKEILQVLSDGVWVIGAASMGALRAAEMDGHGMIGVGAIYEWFATGVLADDDEVALIHAGPEDGHRPLSDPLVNIRATLASAVEDGVISRRDAEQLVALQRARFFPDRRLREVLADAAALGSVDEVARGALAELIASGGVDVKAADARLAIAEVRDRSGAPMPVELRPPMSMSPTFNATVQRDIVVGHDDGLPVSFDAIRRHCALNDPEFDETWRAANAVALVHRLAGVLGISPDDSDRAAAAAAVSARLGCPAGDLSETLAALDMTEDEHEHLVDVEATFSRMRRWLAVAEGSTGLTRPFIDELRLRGSYVDRRRRAGLFERLASGSPTAPAAIPLDRLARLQATLGGWEVPDDLDAYIEAHQLGNRAELYDRLLISVAALHELAGLPLEVPDDDRGRPPVVADPMQARRG